MDKCTEDVTIPRFQAVEGVLSRWSFSPGTSYIPVTQAYGRVLARDVASRNTLPNHLAGNRDGVAFYFDRLIACDGDTSGWREGRDYVFSNTGIGIDGDFDTCILIEHVHFDDEGRISFDDPPAEKGANTVPVGNELKAGDIVARAGQTVSPSIAARLAKAGHTMVDVIRKPRVAFLPSGTELVPAGAELPPCKNIDANSPLILGKLVEAGAEPHVYPILRDDRDEIREAVRHAVDGSDIVIINAGSSKGTDDFTHEVLEELGEILNHQVDTGPGKHTSYALIDGVPVVGLSGPTVCCDYTFDWYVRPLIDRFLGKPDTAFPTTRARLLSNVRFTRKGVTFMLGCHLFLQPVRQDGTLQAVAVPAKNLHDDARLEPKVNCFIALHQGMDLAAGEEVEVELRYPFAAPQVEDLAEMIDDAPFVF